MAESIAPLLIGLFSLAASCVAAFAAGLAAEMSRNTSKEVAQFNGEVSERIAGMNATFNKELKEYEYNLTYLKELALKRLNVYEQFMDAVGGIVETGFDLSRGSITGVFASKDEYRTYVLRFANLLSKRKWLNESTQNEYLSFNDQLVQFADFFGSNNFELSLVLESPELERLITHAESLHQSLIQDLLVLNDYAHLSKALGLKHIAPSDHQEM